MFQIDSDKKYNLHFHLRNLKTKYEKSTVQCLLKYFGWKQIYLLGKYTYSINVGKTRLHTVNLNLLTVNLLPLQGRQTFIRKKYIWFKKIEKLKCLIEKIQLKRNWSFLWYSFWWERIEIFKTCISLKPCRLPLGQTRERILQYDNFLKVSASDLLR